MSNLNTQLRSAVESAICESTGELCHIDSVTPLSGGCINSVMKLDASTGNTFLLKTNANCDDGFFDAEASGLKSLSSRNGPRAPQVIAVGSKPQPFLVLEWIETGGKPRDFVESCGHALAELHREKTNDKFGFQRDNFIGSTPQPNAWNENWIDFFCEQRLRFQFDLVRQSSFADAFRENQIARFMNRVRELFQPTSHEPPALIHGDLWSGNYLCDQQGRAVLIDPAVYYASREAEFGMTVLFGGFDGRFYDAYHETHPLIDNWHERAEIYKLYHLLNHLNLFGSSYLSQCREITLRFL